LALFSELRHFLALFLGGCSVKLRHGPQNLAQDLIRSPGRTPTGKAVEVAAA
jgi:hypothetical protein